MILELADRRAAGTRCCRRAGRPPVRCAVCARAARRRRRASPGWPTTRDGDRSRLRSRPCPTPLKTIVDQRPCRARSRRPSIIADVLPLLDTRIPGRARRTSRSVTRMRAVLAVPLMREGGAYGGIFVFRREARTVLARPGRADRDIRPPGRDRHRQRAAVQRDEGSPRPTDGNQRNPARDFQLAGRRATDAQCCRRACVEALRCSASRRSFWSMETRFRFAAGFGTTSTLKEGETIPLSRGSVTGRAVVDRTLIHMADLAKAPEEDFPIGLELQRRIGHHAILPVPLMREDRAIGAIALWRMEARAFHRQTDRAGENVSPTRRRSRSRTCGCSTRRRRRSSSRRRSRRSCR